MENILNLQPINGMGTLHTIAEGTDETESITVETVFNDNSLVDNEETNSPPLVDPTLNNCEENKVSPIATDHLLGQEFGDPNGDLSGYKDYFNDSFTELYGNLNASNFQALGMQVLISHQAFGAQTQPIIGEWPPSQPFIYSQEETSQDYSPIEQGEVSEYNKTQELFDS